VWDGKLGLNHAVLTLYTFFVWPVVVVVAVVAITASLTHLAVVVVVLEHKRQLFFQCGQYPMYYTSVLGTAVLGEQVPMPPVVLAVQELILTYL
jgi:hypothetical protein